MVLAIDDLKTKGLISAVEADQLELFAAANDTRMGSFYSAWMIKSKPPKPEKFAECMKKLAAAVAAVG